MRKLLEYLRKHFYLDVLAVIFLLLSFIIEPIVGLVENHVFVFNPITQIFEGYWKIITSPSMLITDYVYIAGLGATFFNAATILIINIILIKALKLNCNGPVYAGIIMIVGFSFFGKNIFNTLPVYFGIYLFSLFKGVPFKSFIITTIFSTGISPLVSTVIFGLGLDWYFGVPFGIICGIVAGFILPAIASHTIVFHEGYNLYNTGFALGLIAIFFYGLFKFLNLEIVSEINYDYSNNMVLLILIPVISALSILAGYLNDHKVFSKYLKLIKTSGRLISDYAYEFGRPTVLVNFGIIGLIAFFICLIFRVPINGAVFGGIISILGFAGYGLHAKNVLPVWLGAGLTIFAGMVIKNDYNLTISICLAFIYSSGLAPIAGRYGFVFGFIAGIVHIIISPLTIMFQGGLDLYNGGFTAGFAACMVNVMAEKIFDRGDIHARKSKNM